VAEMAPSASLAFLVPLILEKTAVVTQMNKQKETYIFEQLHYLQDKTSRL
jgi:hypothetical protein